MSHLSNHFRERRLKLGLSYGDLARQVGYGNVSKGANHIVRFERQGNVHTELFWKLTDVLGVEAAEVKELVALDQQAAQQEWEEYLARWKVWVEQPAPMQLIVKCCPAVYTTRPLPDDATTLEKAEEYASQFAKQWHLQVCLVVSRKLRIWVDESGEVFSRVQAEPGQPQLPYMRLLGNKKRFLLNFDGEVAPEDGRA